MNSTSILYVALVIASTGFSQTLLKLGANKAHEKRLFVAYVNPYTLTAYVLYILATLFTVYALKDTPLKLFYSTTSLKFVLILILSKFILQEKIDYVKVIAVSLIVFGVMIFNK